MKFSIFCLVFALALRSSYAVLTISTPVFLSGPGSADLDEMEETTWFDCTTNRQAALQFNVTSAGIPITSADKIEILLDNNVVMEFSDGHVQFEEPLSPDHNEFTYEDKIGTLRFQPASLNEQGTYKIRVNNPAEPVSSGEVTTNPIIYCTTGADDIHTVTDGEGCTAIITGAGCNEFLLGGDVESYVAFIDNSNDQTIQQDDLVRGEGTGDDEGMFNYTLPDDKGVISIGYDTPRDFRFSYVWNHGDNRVLLEHDYSVFKTKGCANWAPYCDDPKEANFPHGVTGIDYKSFDQSLRCDFKGATVPANDQCRPDNVLPETTEVNVTFTCAGDCKMALNDVETGDQQKVMTCNEDSYDWESSGAYMDKWPECKCSNSASSVTFSALLGVLFLAVSRIL